MARIAPCLSNRLIRCKHLCAVLLYAIIEKKSIGKNKKLEKNFKKTEKGMFKTSKAPQIGDNGYNYYTYGLGAAWDVETPTGSVRYKIIEPHWDEDDEYQSFTVAVEGQNDVQLREMTLDRLNYLFDHSLNVVQLEVGELVLLPLMKDEVEKYYKKIVSEQHKKKKETTAKLKESKEYQALLIEEKKLIPEWTQSIVLKSDNELDIERRIGEISAKKKEIMLSLGIEPSGLHAPDVCESCAGKGITVKGKICACAKEQAAQIQAYCAAERRVTKAVKKL